MEKFLQDGLRSRSVGAQPRVLTRFTAIRADAFVRRGFIALALIALSVSQNFAFSQQVRIDFGSLTDMYKVSNLRDGEWSTRQPMTGRVLRCRAFTFIAEALVQSLMPPLYDAHFYDSDRIEVGSFSSLMFEPHYVMIQPGSRARVSFCLPPEQAMAKVVLIKIKGMTDQPGY